MVYVLLTPNTSEDEVHVNSRAIEYMLPTQDGGTTVQLSSRSLRVEEDPDTVRDMIREEWDRVKNGGADDLEFTDPREDGSDD